MRRLNQHPDTDTCMSFDPWHRTADQTYQRNQLAVLHHQNPIIQTDITILEIS
jgi:hypothetical protein